MSALVIAAGVLFAVPTTRHGIGFGTSSTVADRKPAISIRHQPPDAVVSVADQQGNPIDAATVKVLGTAITATSGSDGQAKLPLTPGLYRLAITADGYDQEPHTLNVPSSGAAQPLAVTLDWAPPADIWQEPDPDDTASVYVLDITSLDPFAGTVQLWTYYCTGGWSAGNSTDVGYSSKDQAIEGGRWTIDMVGPGQIDEGWTEVPTSEVPLYQMPEPAYCRNSASDGGTD